ncbi:solute carrier family 12 (sodium/chloride transporters), member 3 isoform 1 [Reticulomyxa filosa]|uniref:Solute carrier family 12 (Sodium/chloride transporters), member 3 isoform 1 n=1 Tax=Reticulomyxa filosa TaxID=46433 RepID=X6NLP2_RETFI|nr:solute carrier family 12 (sodium/chloride transporters), member 3 isoform 1 [Reticulomyxa filosa]|eukprot:ETO26828.1 solute carrier family 12 (sodium/chloride transporters), member 3 isoform 1 [Reticulomyxa filosa]
MYFVLNDGTGTLTAILSTSFIYLVMGIVAAGAITPDGLLHNYFCMVDIAAVPVLVYIGIYVATFTSALSVQFCAPRVLMSVANDNVLSSLKIFGRTNSKGDPVASAFLCFGISLIFVIIGDLNFVAPLITEYTALAGFLLCVGMMFATSWIYALVAFGLGAGVCAYVLHKKPNVYWGSALDTRAKFKANEAVMDLVHYKYHVKNYQPSFLVLCGNPESRLPLVKFVYTLRHGNGSIIYGDILCGKFRDKLPLLNNRASNYLPKYLKMHAFYEKAIAPNLKTGAESLVQLAGLGRLRCNVLVLGFKNNWPNFVIRNTSDSDIESNQSQEHELKQEQEQSYVMEPTEDFSNESYVALLSECVQLKMGFMICRGLEHIPFGKMKSGNVTIDAASLEHPSSSANATIIDVWWLLDDGGLSLLVPHILSIDQFWKKLSSLHEYKEDELTNEKGHEDKDSQLKLKQGGKNVLRQKQRHIIRLFLVSDTNIGEEASQNSDTFQSGRNSDKNAVPTISATQTSRSVQAHLLEVSRISAQGLVDDQLLPQLSDDTDLWQAELAALLRKFRLNINGPYPVRSSRREPTKETLETFCRLTGCKLSESEKWDNTRLNRWLRVGELIQTYSQNQKCVFVTAPHPDSFKDPAIYLGVLDMLSRTQDKRATILIRGNGENVLTFYWE